MHGPTVAAHAVATVQRATQQHVLGADEKGGFFRMNVPILIHLFTPHEDDRGLLSQPFQIFECLTCDAKLAGVVQQI